MAKKTASYQLAIVGGGMVGSLAACLAAQRGYKVAFIEPHPASAPNARKYDLRVSAINPQSLQMLEELQVWSQISRACPYRRLRVFSDGSAGVNFYAADYGLEALGQIVENSAITYALQQSAAERGAEIIAAQAQSIDSSSLHLDSGLQLNAEVILLTTGQSSTLQRQLGIGSKSSDYRQRALVAQVATESSQQDITWQRFNAEGAQALLPLVGNNASLVWYMPPEHARQLLDLSAANFQEHLLRSYPEELGEIKSVKARASFALSWRHALDYYQGNCALAGDSAHSVSPIAGLGVNLGFADIRCLFEQFDRFELDPERAFPEYQRIRKRANSQIITSINLIQASFQHWQFPISALRARALEVADWCSPIKKLLWRQASYLQGV